MNNSIRNKYLSCSNGYFLLIAVMLTVGIFSCEKQVPFDDQFSNSKLVVNGLFSQDSSWNINISRSLSAIDTADLDAVHNASVRILDESGNVVTTLTHTGNGDYEAPSVFPVVGEQYTIEASAPGYPSVTATDRIPGTVQILSLDTVEVRGQEGQRMLDVTLTFADPAGEKNYYILNALFEAVIYYPGKDTFRYGFTEYMICNDPNVEQNLDGLGDSENYLKEIQLRDDPIDGTTYELVFRVRNPAGSNVFHETIMLFFTSGSEAFFNYSKSYSAYQDVDGDPFAQPVQVFSNVEGGFGIFAGGSRSTWTIHAN